MGDTLKAPFPWFGGKRKVAAQVWAALGDVDNYVEPFAGSLAVLLARPEHHSRRAETINDFDQYVANFWRALAYAPEDVAHHADWPVNEADLFARHLWLVNEGRRQMQVGMEADPEWYDSKIAGWWLWGVCAWIGSGWCSGTGPHNYETIAAGPLAVDGDAGRGVNRTRPHLGAGQGVNRQLPHLGAGRGAIYDYMHQLAERLRNVRVCCGDWSRVVTNGALNYGDSVGVFLDPPYAAEAGRTADLYASDDLNVAHAVREWAIANGDNPRYRIVLAGYEDEHADHMPSTWRMEAYSANRAYGSSAGGGLNAANRHKERLWYSPHCLTLRRTLFDGIGD